MDRCRDADAESLQIISERNHFSIKNHRTGELRLRATHSTWTDARRESRIISISLFKHHNPDELKNSNTMLNTTVQVFVIIKRNTPSN